MKKVLFSIIFILPTLAIADFIYIWNKIENFFTSKQENVGLAWLKINPIARATALADAYVATVDDASATWWNPARLSLNENIHTCFTYNKYFQNINRNFAAISYKKNKNAFAFGILSTFIDNIELRNEQQKYIDDYGAYNFLLSLSYARILSNDLFVGATFKKIYERIYIYELSSFAMDLGANFIPFENLDIGATIVNLGPSCSFYTISRENENEEKIKQPFGWRLGASYNFINLLVSIELNKYIDASAKLGMGFEFRPVEMFAFRIGNIFGSDTKFFTAGFGIKYKKIIIDYAWCPFRYEIGSSHIFTLNIE